jgi:hypothetical protein
MEQASALVTEYFLYPSQYPKLANAIALALDAARAEEREAYDYLRRVFEICAPECEPLPDLMGLCTQIDNLIAGYRIALEKIGESEERTSE